ncbi:HD domain-containing phosphohydrolase [Terrilactibacillus sp. S3-3]|nr:HD domain-containing phosphohydrolase [Terrilactibacillus sp. S3-3]
MYWRKFFFSKSTRPLIKAGTVLKDVHLKFLEAFLIETVYVKNVLADGKFFQYDEDAASKPAAAAAEEPKSLDEKYAFAVRSYRSFFLEWQSGKAIDIGRFRRAMLPLLTDLFDSGVSWLANYIGRETMVQSAGDRAVAVGVLSAFLEKCDLSQGEVLQVGMGGVLADCGLAKLPRSLLERKDSLTAFERRAYEEHPVHGYKMLKNVATIKEGTPLAVLQHHEYVDGSGYPLKLTGSELHEFGKIVAIADNFLQIAEYAPHTNRPFCILEKMETTFYGKLSHYLWRKFCTEMMTLYIGARVKLSDGRLGEITFIPDKSPTRPLIRLENNRVIVLSQERDLMIDKVAPFPL